MLIILSFHFDCPHTSNMPVAMVASPSSSISSLSGGSANLSTNANASPSSTSTDSMYSRRSFSLAYKRQVVDAVDRMRALNPHLSIRKACTAAGLKDHTYYNRFKKSLKTAEDVVTQRPNVPYVVKASHNSFGAVFRRRSSMPIPLSKRSVTREMPHPSGCSSQVRPLLVCVRPTKMMCLLGGGTGASGKLLFIILRWMCK